MATIKVVDLIARAGTILQDSDGVRWPLVERQDWLNDGYIEIVNLRPDANAITGIYVCTQGTRQALTDQFETAQRLISINSNGDGWPVSLVPRQALDRTRLAWHAETPSTLIEQYVFEPVTPTQFWVYPPAESGAQLELTYSALPTPHTLTAEQLVNSATTEVIRISDTYANALLDYMLYRAFTKDAESQVAMQRAVAHYQAMTTGLGVKTQSDQAVNPRG